MEQLRQPSALLAFAAGVLVLNLLVLVTDAASGGAVDDTIGAPSEAAAGTESTGGDDGASQQEGGATADEGQEQAGDGTAADEGGGAGQDATGGGESGGDEQDGDEGQAGGGGGEGVLTAPTAGTYQYASSGEWSLSGGGADERHQLPATATGTVTADGDAWQLQLRAGQDYADTFTFRLAPDGGLDWSRWVLDRTFDSGASTTSYDCSGEGAYFRPDEQGRTVTHTCSSSAGITSNGTIEHLGSEDVTLGDGSTVAADRLLYTYTVSGEGVSGEGRLDLWLDPGTGLRVREARDISTTQGQSSYREQVDVVLQRAQPDA